MFPNPVVDVNADRQIIPYLVAMQALATGLDTHELFAVNVLYGLMKDARCAAELEDTYGFTYGDLIGISGWADYSSLRSMRAMRAYIDNIHDTLAWKVATPLRVLEKAVSEVKRVFRKRA